MKRFVVDAHVHVFPPRVMAAIQRWFNDHAWPIPQPRDAEATLDQLFAQGIGRAVGLAYAHVPGMAAQLNSYMAGMAAREPRLVPCATVLPGEPGARSILDEALGPLGLRGVKIHCHVQCVAPDDPRLDDVYAAAAAHDVPVIIHAGDAPASPHYRCDVRELCRTEHLERALRRHPGTTIIVPHLGAEQMEEISALLDEHPRLHLDSTMMLARFFPTDEEFRAPDLSRVDAWFERAIRIIERWPDRVLYGTDAPNLPYPWTRELEQVEAAPLSEATRTALLSGNAVRMFKLDEERLA